MGKIKIEKPQPDWGNMLSCLIGVIIGLIVCALMGSCKSHERIISDHSCHDSTWMVKVTENGHGDSIVYKERIFVVPRIVRVGDTTLVTMDTTIYKYTERTVNNNINRYYNTGKSMKDSSKVESLEPSEKEKRKSGGIQWKTLVCGIAAGAIITLVVLILSYRKAIFKHTSGQASQQ